MVFVADDLAAWLTGLLADAGRKKLTTLVLGSDQERALRSAAKAAVLRTAEDLRPGDVERAGQLAMVVSEVFGEPEPGAPLTGHATVLEALQGGIAAQLAVLDDVGRTGTGRSSADVMGVSGVVVATKLTGHLVREIIVRGARGGPLFPLASQMNDDATHLQGQRIETELGQLASDVRQALARIGGTHPTAATALAPLPPLVTGFTGRDAELAVLAALLDPAGSEGPVVVSAVAGLAGIGKTTLVVHAGHAARERGWFGGGLLFIDLHGYDKAPVEPAQALDALLRALGVPADHFPPTVEERAGLYRSVLARSAEPVLVIADNASAEAQVRPLLPGTGPHKVLVTSRHTLAGLDARLVDLTVLDDAAGIELLDAALRAARPEDDRISVDPECAQQLARLCGGLPLALQIVGAILKAEPTLSTGDLAKQLAAEAVRLEQLAYDDGGGPRAPSVVAAFELSDRRLDETSARVFRLLSVNPGPDISTTAATALVGLPGLQTRTVLAGLARAHLIEPAAGVVGRWRMHDLVRLYAQRMSDQHAEADGREQARDRVLAYYLLMADAANDHLEALQGTTEPAVFDGRESALRWLDEERLNLIAGASMAADTGRDRIALALPIALTAYFSWRRLFDDWLATMTISLRIARDLGDNRIKGVALTKFGMALGKLGRVEEAINACRDAAALFRQAGDQHAEGGALGNLASSLHEAGRFEEAITACGDAAALFRQAGDRRGEGKALTGLGNALLTVGRSQEAITAQLEATAIMRETGDSSGEGMALNNLGNALRQAGRLEDAITAYEEAVTLSRETGNLHSEGEALGNLGGSLNEADRFEEAITACEDAALLFRETGDPHSEAMALNDLGNALYGASQFKKAITAHHDAAVLFRQTGDRRGEVKALGNLALDKAARG